jgi:nucleotide-binding universal stress UspA family protein
MKTIVAAIDFSDLTRRVVETARKQAEAFGAELYLIHVVEPEPAYTAYGFTPDDFPAMGLFQQEARKRAQTKLEEVAASAPGSKVVLVDGSPLHGILEQAKSCGADLVVVGSHGHGMVASLLLGSVAEGLVRKAAVPTMVVPAQH